LKEKKKKRKQWLIGMAGVIVFLPILWFLLARFEGEKPQISFEFPLDYIGKSQDFVIAIHDKKSGVRKIWVSLIKNGKEVVLHDADFPSAGFLGAGKVKEKILPIKIEPKKFGFSDGNAILRMVVRDYSWRGWWHGNQTYIEKTMIIDTQPPEIEVISKAHNLSQGGAGLVIYRTSETCRQTGVHVGNNFFPGYAGYFKDSHIRLAFIGLNYDQGPGTQIVLNAIDQAGNRTTTGFNHYIRKKGFKNDTINISDGFLNRKVPEFEQYLLASTNASQVDKFIKINRDLRQENYNQITELGNKASTAIHWKGSFLRLPRSATQAGFGDQRVYTYKGRVIDRQVHLGVDLASVAHAPVPAANGGIVAFTGNLGIYGRTILIDHGFSLFSMYSHLNRIDVKVGQRVAKGETLGRSGSTGLAGGDHLHFGVLVHNTFVNPIEWWDAAWIKNNILSKIKLAQSVSPQN
jgi:murein DD-endopeptidase MepM/ murein hydrolase activator NlpD